MSEPLRSLIHRMADELDHYRQLLMDDRREAHALATEARVALAQPEPERKINWPAYFIRQAVVQEQELKDALAQPEPEGPTLDDIDDLCAEHSFYYEDSDSLKCLLLIITDALARWGRSDGPAVPDGREPASVASNASGASPADGEVAELANSLRHSGDALRVYGLHGGADDCQRAADLLERLSPPQPISVSERLPGPGDCLDEGWAWFFNPRTGWRQATQPVHSTYTHWLPARALPVPS